MHQAMFLFFLAGLLTLARPATGQQFYGDKKYGEYYEEEKKWVELEAGLPDFPKPQNLIEFHAGAATDNRYYVDGSTVSVGEDGVVRYVVVVNAAGGAQNTYYEGIRCTPRTRKFYAFGRGEGIWSKARNQEWQPIRPGSYQAILLSMYFCPGNMGISKAEEGVDALRRGAHSEPR